MSKARIMGAASSGYNYGVNKNSPGNGNGKWQGLWPSVGHARNARLINTRAGGNNRNVVFCMNQLGGVGKISNMFATTADGVQDCKNGCILSSNIKNALQQLTNYAGKQGLLLGLAGVKETIASDLPKTSGLTPFDKNFSPEMQKYVDLINGLGLEFAVTGPKDIQKHEVVMLTETDAKFLKKAGFGFSVSSLCDSIIAYGKNCAPITSDDGGKYNSDNSFLGKNSKLTILDKQGNKVVEGLYDHSPLKTLDDERDKWWGPWDNSGFVVNLYLKSKTLVGLDKVARSGISTGKQTSAPRPLSGTDDSPLLAIGVDTCGLVKKKYKEVSGLSEFLRKNMFFNFTKYGTELNKLDGYNDPKKYIRVFKQVDETDETIWQDLGNLAIQGYDAMHPKCPTTFCGDDAVGKYFPCTKYVATDEQFNMFTTKGKDENGKTIIDDTKEGVYKLVFPQGCFGEVEKYINKSGIRNGFRPTGTMLANICTQGCKRDPLADPDSRLNAPAVYNIKERMKEDPNYPIKWFNQHQL